ncbi:hypothetical protein AFLA_013220 [Aspergillus flavus NRRL3357]|nr:hypothetical protein AFLA_013220 [Aspergillus flavus NRRL3357]
MTKKPELFSLAYLMYGSFPRLMGSSRDEGRRDRTATNGNHHVPIDALPLFNNALTEGASTFTGSLVVAGHTRLQQRP